MSISGSLATAMPCGWAFHSSRLRTSPPTQPPSAIACSMASPSHWATASASASRVSALAPVMRKRAGAMMRMVGVQEHDAPVARRVVPGQRIPRHRLLAVLQHVGVGAQRRRRGMTIDRHALRLAGPQPPQVGDREADRAQRRRARRRDAPWCEEHRILAAGDGERIVAAFGAAELGEDRVGEVRAHVSAMILLSVAIRSCGQVMCGLWLASIS